MVSKEVLVRNKTGLESKIAAKLIQKASEYDSSIWIQKGDRKANAKSLLGILSLSISVGETITVIAEGSDEERAADELESFVQKGLMN